MNRQGSSNKQVLMVAPTSFFKDYGGHIRIYEEATALQALGNAVTIVTYHIGDDMPGMDIRRTWSLPYHADYEVGSSRHKITFDIYLLLKTLQVGLQVRPDLVHGHMHEGALIGGMVARLLGVPLIFDFQGSLTSEMVDHGFLTTNQTAYKLFRRLERVACRLPDATLTSSYQAKDLLVDDFGVDEDTIVPLPDCVDTQRFDPDCLSQEEKNALKQHLGIPLGIPVVAYLGLLADYQGTPEIIQAAAALRSNGIDAFFLIMGFPRCDQYQQMAKDRGLADRMLFTGKVEYRDAPRFLSLGNMAVSAKMSDTEGSGKVLNYMAMSMPVVAFDTPVHREYLGDLGVYAPVRDVLKMAQGIASLIEDPNRAASLGRELRKKAESAYSWEQAAMQITELYNSLT